VAEWERLIFSISGLVQQFDIEVDIFYRYIYILLTESALLCEVRRGKVRIQRDEVRYLKYRPGETSTALPGAKGSG
jgi:hypothetical protein